MMNNSLFPIKLLSFIWSILRPQKWVFACVLFFSFTWSLDAILWPYILRVIIDQLGQHETQRHLIWQFLKYPLISGVALWVGIEACFRIQGLLLSKAIPKLEADIRTKMFDHVVSHSPKYFNKHFAGSLANKITDMTTQVSSLITLSLWAFIPALSTCIVSLFFFFPINPLFTLLLAGMVLAYGWICFFHAKKCEVYEKEHGEARSLLIGKIVDSLTNNFAINLFYRFTREKKYIASFQTDEFNKNHRAKKTVEKMRLALALTFLPAAFLINSLMLYLWSVHKISTGEIVQIFNMMWNIILILWMAGTEMPSYFQSIGIAKQALSVMAHPQDILDVPTAKPLVITKGEIIFKNVDFLYGNQQLFHNKNVHIQGGEKVGLVGYSGAGKSTFLNLILRFYPVNSGQILIDNQDIAHISLKSLRRQISLIPQDPLLFHRSFEENILYGNPDASREDLVTVAKLAHCHEFITKSSEGYQTLVGERGANLSGGERQRIAIARALLANTPILLLDEATSALDAITETYIQETFAQLMYNRTTVAIAHRLTTIAKMDRLLVFHQGKIIEEGTHHDLLAKNGHYANLWRTQAGGFLPEAPAST